VPFIQDNEASADVRAAFEAANRFNGRVANSMRVSAMPLYPARFWAYAE
jgi:hypothetical protein